MNDPETTLFPDLHAGAVAADPVRESAFDEWWENTLIPGVPESPGQSEDIAHEAFCAGWDAAAPLIRVQALRELAAELKADAQNPALRSIWRGLMFSADAAEEKANEPCR